MTTSVFHFPGLVSGISLGLLLAGWFGAAGCAGGAGGATPMPESAPPRGGLEVPPPAPEAPVPPPPPPSRTRGPESPRNPDVVMAFGDSLTAGGVGPSFPDILDGLIGKTVTNDGLSASTARAGVARASSVIAERNGSCMLILYGINDLLFDHSPREIAALLADIVHVCETWHVTPVLATYPRPIRRHAEYARRTMLLNETIRQLAASRGIRLVDIERAFMAGGAPDPSLYLEDGLHPSPRGNKLIARVFADLF